MKYVTEVDAKENFSELMAQLDSYQQDKIIEKRQADYGNGTP